MSDISTKDMTQYLKTVVDLEASIYHQEQVRESAIEWLKHIRPEKQIISEPTKPSNKPQKPTPPSPSSSKGQGISVGAVCVGLLFLIVGVLGFVVLGLMDHSVAMCILYIFLAIVGFFVLSLGVGLYGGTKSAAAKRQEDYKKELAAYNEELQAIEDAYQESLAQYHSRLETLEKEYASACKIARQNRDVWWQSIAELDAYLKSTKDTLQKLYDVDWIFPKYRNLVAMSTIYEYFASGRCSELTGPNGAYNLYESELRQNLIIDKLDVIVSQLEEIRQNQYILYNEVQKTNRALAGIKKDMDRTLRVAKNIEQTTSMIAQFSYVTAQNTEALKYIALIS